MTHLSRRTSLVGLAAICATGFSSEALADTSSPVGLWTTIDDETNQPKSVVQLELRNGVLFGRVVELINPKEKDPKCEECSGDKKNKPIQGLEIMWGLKADGGEWSGGFVLDPESGNEYRCYVEVLDGGQRLKVRGYLGIALLGRTQYWRRKK